MMGPWANVCRQHFDYHRCVLGLGRGQRFVLKPTTDVIDPSNGVVWSPDDEATPCNHEWLSDRPDEWCQHCNQTRKESEDMANKPECGGHPPGPYDQAGLTVYCDGSCEELDEWATEWAVYIAFECGNCHNILRLMPEEAIDQVFDAEGWVLCGCGAPIAGETHRGTWTP
jgi:hypothetical protein